MLNVCFGFHYNILNVICMILEKYYVVDHICQLRKYDKYLTVISVKWKCFWKKDSAFHQENSWSILSFTMFPPVTFSLVDAKKTVFSLVMSPVFPSSSLSSSRTWKWIVNFFPLSQVVWHKSISNLKSGKFIPYDVIWFHGSRWEHTDFICNIIIKLLKQGRERGDGIMWEH